MADVRSEHRVLIQNNDKHNTNNKRLSTKCKILSILLVVLSACCVLLFEFINNLNKANKNKEAGLTLQSLIPTEQKNGWVFGDDIEGYTWKYIDGDDNLMIYKIITDSLYECKSFCIDNSCSSWTYKLLSNECRYILNNDISSLTLQLKSNKNIISGCGVVNQSIKCEQNMNTICSNYNNEELSIHGSQRLIISNGLQRCYYAFVPPQCFNNNHNKCSLSFVHTGGGGNAISFSSKTSEMRQRMLSIHADSNVNWANPSILIYTQQINGYNSGFNLREICGIDDVKYIFDIINDLDNNLNVNINYNKIYSIGFSSGAKFSHYLPYKLQNKYSINITAIGTSSGIYGTDFGVNVAKPTNKIHVICIHGYNDQSNSFYGEETRNCLNMGHQSVVNMMYDWSINNECNSLQDGTAEIYDDDGNIIKRKWNNCPQSIDIELYSPTNLGHSWSDQTSVVIAEFLENRSIIP